MLGLQLGRLPSELGSMMAAEETLLMAAYRDDPWGSHRQDVMLAQIAQILWNVNVNKKEKARKLVDFLPFYRKPVKEDPEIATSVKTLFGKIMSKK